MMQNLTLIIHDEVNFEILGLTDPQILRIKAKLEKPVKGAFTSAAFKAKIWNGKDCQFSDDGIGLIYDLPVVFDCLESFGFDLDRHLKVDDRRLPIGCPEDMPLIDDSFPRKFLGFDFRDYQTHAVNAAIKHRKGVFDIGTNGGKSYICACISLVYEDYFPSLLIVPSETLANQTAADYRQFGLDVGVLNSDVKPKNREAFIKKHRHIIVTTKLMNNVASLFEGKQYVLIIDETHVFGTVTAEALRFELGSCPVRLGLTATLPKESKNAFKRHMILSHIGGDVLAVVKQQELIARGVSSDLKIIGISVRHPEIDELSKETTFDWSVEDDYLGNNLERVEAIAKFIQSFDLDRNTLILCHAAFAKRLGTITDIPYIIDETNQSERERIFGAFNTEDTHIMAGTFGTCGTGLSSKRIFRAFVIDVGKDETAIIQGIGRMLRVDGVVNSVEVYDISSMTKFSLRHKKERLNIYKAESFPYEEGGIIEVEQEPIDLPY